ncbi:MAG: hypothetical protein J1E07_09430 [Treponema sp.]|nr:hypothetical protein [Treponema sp.]
MPKVSYPVHVVKKLCVNRMLISNALIPGLIISIMQKSAQRPLITGTVICGAGIHVTESGGRIRLRVKATARIKNARHSRILCGVKKRFI